MPGRMSPRSMSQAGMGAGIRIPNDPIFNSPKERMFEGKQAGGPHGKGAGAAQPRAQAGSSCLSLIPTLSDTPPHPLLSAQNRLSGFLESEIPGADTRTSLRPSQRHEGPQSRRAHCKGGLRCARLLTGLSEASR